MNDVWNYLKNTDKPIVMYGTGNGADKILDIFYTYGIKVSDICTSDDFYRPKNFRGYPLIKLSDVMDKYEDCIIVLAFAVFREDMIKKIKDISTRFEVLAPHVSIFGTKFFSYEILQSCRKEIKKAYHLLYDEKSKQVFENIIRYRLSGKLQYLYDCEDTRDDVFNTIIKLRTDEIYLDLGAYRGDTIEEFLKFTEGKYEKIIALEPDIKNYNKLCDYVDSQAINKIETHNKASWFKKEAVRFDGGGGRNSSIMDPLEADTGHTVDAIDVDTLLEGSPVSYVKMDVEGSEIQTIMGMEKTIETYKPKLAISAYHHTDDLFVLPLLIHRLNKDYKIFLRHHPYIPDWETNYYCI